MVVILEQLQLKSGKANFYDHSHWALYFFSLHALCECSCSSANLPTCHVACGYSVYSGDLEKGSAAVQGKVNMLVFCNCLLVCNSGMYGFIIIIFSTLEFFPQRGFLEFFFFLWACLPRPK